MTKRLLLILLVFSPVILFSQTSAKAKELVAQLSLEEKLQLVTGMGFELPDLSGPDTSKSSISGVASSALYHRAAVRKTPEKVPGAAGKTHAIERLGIPTLILSDGPAGVRIEPVRKDNPGKTYYATAFPSATLLASSWDTVLVKKVGVAFGKEAKEYGVDILLAPALNIHRNPLCGRNFEYYSEDPVVAGTIAAAIVNGIQSNGVGTSIKHFVANNQETHRTTVNAIIGERALREIYLKGFEITVKKSNPWTVMSSYNLVNGVYTSENKELITGILRKEWGFKGLVMTDWGGGKDAVAQQNAGNDLLMAGTLQQFNALREAVKNGTLSEAQLTENTAHILSVILQCPAYKGYQYSDRPDLKASALVSRRAAAEGMVLLKNEQALPLKKKTSIALLGNASYDLVTGGTGSGDVHHSYSVQLDQGLKAQSYAVDTVLEKRYQQYLSAAATDPAGHSKPRVPGSLSEMDLTETDCQQLARQNEVAIITIGRNTGEGRDRKVENDFNLSEKEQSLINNITNAFHAESKKVVVVLNIGSVVEVTGWQNKADAVLVSWLPGLEGGNAIADILSGKVNPSGKLTSTFPVTYADVPSAKNFPGRELPLSAAANAKKLPQVSYEEGIYVGYRYFNTFHVKSAYEFGYGLSYTQFDYTHLKLSTTSFADNMQVTVTITNKGKVSGKEVVQLYVSAPSVQLAKPASELKAFAKTELLRPGQSQTITFKLNKSDLASYDPQSAAWTAESGNYTIGIGASSLDIRQKADFTVDKDILVEQLHHYVLPEAAINELKQ